jgi:tetratricopeptide (TPR) repeat protein
MCRRAPLCPAKVAKESPSTASELPVLAIYKTIINMPARLYWAINMGLFDRFKSDKAPTQKADAAAWVKNGGAYVSGRHQEALQCFDKALAIDPQNAGAQQVKRKSSASK